MMTRLHLPRLFRGAFVALTLAAPVAKAGDRVEFLQDINPGPDSSWTAFSFVKAGSSVYFTAGPADDANAVRLWRTDGTPGGTTEVPGSPVAYWPTAVGDTLFFGGCAAAPAQDCRVWKVDATGTCVQVTHEGQGDGPRSLTAFQGTLFYAAREGSSYGLWKMGPTGPELVSTFSYLGEYFTAMGDHLYFAADGKLWRTDGTPEGTRRVGPETLVLPSNQTKLTAFNDELYFMGNDLADPTDGLELWKSNGDPDGPGGTLRVKDLFPGMSQDPTPQENSSSPMDFEEVNGALYFSATIAHDAQGNPCGPLSSTCWGIYRELWKTDGKPEGTVLLKDTNAPGPFFPRDLTAVGSMLFFSAEDPVAGRELWRSDGTVTGTTKVKDICARGGDDSLLLCGATFWDFPLYNSSIPTDLTAFRGRLYFAAWLPGHGRELLRTNTAGDDVELVADIKPGEEDPCAEWEDTCLMPGSAFGHSGAFFTAIDDTLFLRADDGVHGEEPWTLRSLTPQEEITGIIEEVEGLGTLKPGQGKSLVGKLEMALQRLEAGDTRKAITMLEAFIHEVRAFKNAGILDSAQADDWIAIAEGVIASI